MSSITRATRKAIEMSKDEIGQDAERQQDISDFAPRRTQEPYLTDAMIKPPAVNIKLGDDALRLTQMAGPALAQIGTTTADKIELSAQTLVDNAKAGAETILGEARIQADDMVAMAEMQAADMRVLAQSIRTHSARKAGQVGAFCAVAESIITTMHALGSNFQSVIVADMEAEKVEQEQPIQIPTFLARSVKRA